MSDELNNEAGVTTPATVAGTPVVPSTEAPTEIPVIAPESIQAPATAEQVPVETEHVEEQGPETEPVTESAPVEIEVTEEMVAKATDAIKHTGRSSIPFIQRILQADNDTTLAVIDELVTRGVLGDYKDPRNKMTPRIILIEIEKKAPVAKVKVNRAPRKVITDADRLESWKGHLRKIGGYTNEWLIDAMAQFALKNQGFNPQAKWGSCLIVMLNRFATKLRDSLRTFNKTDADYMMRELLRFASSQPLGDGPIVWNTRYGSNMEQKGAVSEFFDINKPFREIRGKPQQCMTAVRDAAWPNREEEAKGTGGTYAERFHYLALCLVALGSSEYGDALFENTLHNEPSDRFLEMVGGVRQPRETESWHKDGKCTSCGYDVSVDTSGNTICSNPMCMKHYASVSTGAPASFRSGGRPTREENIPVGIPEPANKRRNWKKKSHDFHDDEGGDMRKLNRKHFKKQRFHESADMDDNDAPQSPAEAGKTVFSTGEFRSDAFEGLTLPAAPAERPIV